MLSVLRNVSLELNTFDVIIASDKATLFFFFFQQISIDIFLISPQKHMLAVLIRKPHQDPSNEYPQNMFLRRNKH